jgi:hypothetical protein
MPSSVRTSCVRAMMLEDSLQGYGGNTIQLYDVIVFESLCIGEREADDGL